MDHDRVKGALVAFAIGAAFAIWTAGAFAIGRQAGKRGDSGAVNVRTDTLVVRDTLRVLEPVEIERWRTREILVQVRDTVRLRDTLMMALPEERATYQGEDYRAVVSGIRPQLEEIDVFPKTTVVTKEVRVEVPAPQRWRRIGLGVAAGPGVFWQPGMDNVTPGAGIVVGLRVNL